MSPMTISYQISRRDFVDACIAMSRNTYWFLFGLWLLLAVFSAWMNGSEMLRGSSSQRIAAFLPLVGCGLFFLLIAWISPRYKASRMILREVTWTLGDEGVHLASSVSTTDLRWEAFLRYREAPKVFLLFVQKGMAQFIPKRVLTTEQADDLRMLLGNHIKTS
jgi:YcxB-like protein